MMWVGWFGVMFLTYIGLIKWAKKKQMGQAIYEDSPVKHQQKQGTPTMGGLVMWLGLASGLVLFNQWSLPLVWVMLTTTLFAIIGLIDDAMALRHNQNKGLSARGKLMAQIGVSLLCVGVLGMWVLPMMWWHWPVYVFLLTGASNATNLTDGLDGLLGSVMLVSLLGVWVVFQSVHMYEEGSVTLMMMAIVACFLLFNWHPAKLFMGDVGSLLLGAFLASSIIVTGQWWLLLGFGAVYVIETLSVIAQVIGYKKTKKRLFLMTPLHHHFELLGLKETQIVLLFVVIQAVFVWVQCL